MFSKNNKRHVERLNSIYPLVNGERIPIKIRCYDGDFFDRYTIVFTGNFPGRGGRCYYLASSEFPFHPQGFGQHGESPDIIDRPKYSHLGNKVKYSDLPEQVKKFICQEYEDFWNLPGYATRKELSLDSGE